MVHIKNQSSDPVVGLSVVMFLISKDVTAGGVRACRRCRTPVLEKHRDDRAPDEMNRHVLIAIYCFWTSRNFQGILGTFSDRPAHRALLRKSPNTNGCCVQTNRHENMVDTPK